MTVIEKANRQVGGKIISVTVRTLSIHLIGITIAIAFLLAAPTTSLATGLPTNLVAALPSVPFEERSATLTSPREGAPIALYIRPAPNQQPVGYGISGDRVTVTDQFGDYLMEDDPSATWSHIRLNNAPYTEGWLRGRFLSLEAVDQSQR